MNGEKVSLDKVDSIIKQPRWLPSSRFATFEIMVVTNQVKQKIREIGWNQSVIRLFHLLVFAAWDVYSGTH
jgi:hypothetical protein